MFASASSLKDAIPEDVQSLVTPETFFLLNKADLAPPQTLPLANNKAWSVSLATEERTGEFLAGFSEALQNL